MGEASNRCVWSWVLGNTRAPHAREVTVAWCRWSDDMWRRRSASSLASWLAVRSLLAHTHTTLRTASRSESLLTRHPPTPRPTTEDVVLLPVREGRPALRKCPSPSLSVLCNSELLCFRPRCSCCSLSPPHLCSPALCRAGSMRDAVRWCCLCAMACVGVCGGVGACHVLVPCAVVGVVLCEECLAVPLCDHESSFLSFQLPRSHSSRFISNPLCSTDFTCAASSTRRSSPRLPSPSPSSPPRRAPRSPTLWRRP